MLPQPDSGIVRNSDLFKRQTAQVPDTRKWGTNPCPVWYPIPGNFGIQFRTASGSISGPLWEPIWDPIWDLIWELIWKLIWELILDLMWELIWELVWELIWGLIRELI